MKSILHKIIHSRPGGVLAAGTLAIVLLAVPARAQFVTTAISNVINEPFGAATDTNNNLYVTDSGNNQVVVLPLGSSTVTTVASGFNQPEGIVYSPGRNALVVSDQGNQVLRLVTFSGNVSTLAGLANQPGYVDGAALGHAQFSYPAGLAVGNDGNSIYIADTGNSAIRLLSNNAVSTIATTYLYNGVAHAIRSPAAVAVDASNNVWFTDTAHDVICVITNGSATAYGVAGAPSSIGTNDSSVALNARFQNPSGLYYDNTKSLLIISDTLNDTIRTLFPTNGAYGTATLAGIPGQKGYVDGGLGASEFFKPIGICVDSNALGYFVVDQGNNAVRVLQPTKPPPPPTPVPDPVIGYVTFPVNNGTQEAEFNPITQQISVFNNVPVLAIQQNDTTVTTYLEEGPTGSVLPALTTNSPKAPVFTEADSGTLPSFAVNYELNSNALEIIPNLTLETYSAASGRPSSDAISAQLEFDTANPIISGQDAAAVTLFDATTNAQMWYTLDGATPVPGASDTFPVSTTIGVTNGQIISFIPVTNTTLSVKAFCSNSTEIFAPSGVVTALFTTNSYQTDDITFGFATGEASSKFLTAPGQTFIAPVTLSLIPSASTIYTLQFNLAVAAYPPSPTVIGVSNANFSSMLMKPIPGSSPPVYTNILPDMVAVTISNQVTNGMTNYFTNAYFTNLVFTNIETNTYAYDLLGVGWLERPANTNLYDTQSQTLVTFSEDHDTLWKSSGGQVVVGAFSFDVPTSAPIGSQFEIQVGSPSATSDGISTPVVIDLLTNTTTNGLGAGTMNSYKVVTVTNNQYLVGDVAPFSWFNAGDFGDNYLANNDVTETFQTAVYGLNGPVPATTNSDYFDAMDSSDGAGNFNYEQYTDATIDGILYGDHIIAVDDVWVTYRRSLDPSLHWVYRQDKASGKFAFLSNNLIQVPFSGGVPASVPAAQPQSTNSGPRYISVAADQVVSGGNLSVSVPVRVVAADTLPITTMMVRVEVDPLDGSPPITEQVEFTPNSNLGTSFATMSQFTNDIAGVWLNQSSVGVSGTSILGTVTVQLPPNVTANSAYLVHFDHFSCSPNGFALFHAAVQDGLITVSDRSASSWGDGIPDKWRLLWFGTISNAMSAANLDPDGDGANNWQEYIAGTNPNSASSVFQFMTSACTSSTSGFTLQWSSVANKSYTVQRSFNPTPGNWTTIATNILGTGQIMQWTDTSAGAKSEYYRALVQ